MSVLERVHGTYVHDRRVRVLARELSILLPDHGQILDVGCGDGLLAATIQSEKPGRAITGLDVLVRKNTHVPVQHFDGHSFPFAADSFDALMFVDVLHHTEDPEELLREAARVSRHSIIIKDHTLNGVAAATTLRFMDRIGNRRHGVALPHNYWPEQRWLDTFSRLGLIVEVWKTKLGLYAGPADFLFGRSLHFIARVAAPDRLSADR